MNESLTSLKCALCSGKTPKLNYKEIDKNLNKLNNWKINNDKEMIFKSVKKTNKVIVLHEETLTGGFGAEISLRQPNGLPF